MSSEAQILEVVQASNRAEELAGQFYQLCQRILNDGMAVHRGTPACDMAMEIMDEQNKLFCIVYPAWARYPTIVVFQEDNPRPAGSSGAGRRCSSGTTHSGRFKAP